MSSIFSFRSFFSRFQWVSLPEKVTVFSFLALIIVLGIQAASTNHDASQSQETLAQTRGKEQSDAMPTSIGEAPSDPLDSPYPIPWPWILETQSQAASLTEPQIRYYRSQALLSPDRKYAAYSRIQMEVVPDAIAQTVNSMLFLENLETGDLEFVTASSPYVRNPNIEASEYGQPGMIAVLLPIAWSESGDRLLVRGFDSVFGTDLASDYAIVWNRESNLMRAIAPNNLQYSNAVLLGWSQASPENILFRAGQLGDEQWPMVAVDMNSYAVASSGDQPIAYGQLSDDFWSGPQARIGAQ